MGLSMAMNLVKSWLSRRMACFDTGYFAVFLFSLSFAVLMEIYEDLSIVLLFWKMSMTSLVLARQCSKFIQVSLGLSISTKVS